MAARKDGSLDTHAAVRALQAHGFSLEQAEGITEVVLDATAGIPTPTDLRTFVLEQDVKLERLRTEMHQEFGRVHSALTALHGHVTRLDTQLNRLAWLPWGVVALSGGMAALLVHAFVLR
jgi:hypothetical protein